MDRMQKDRILADLHKKMVFLCGPRQVGKTWLSKQILKEYKDPLYLNFDSEDDREIIENRSWLPKTDLLIFDELHKMNEWKNYLKGVFDTKDDHLHILVTGSARLETFRQSGDSLAGRFFRHRLLPFSLSELSGSKSMGSISRLISRGGFPEPLLCNEEVDAKRWRNQYVDGLIRTDILDFEKVHDFKAIQMVLSLLQKRVGSPVSFSSIAQDVGVAPNTVKKYIEIFESLYIVFRVTPYSKNIARSILKEPKVYFYDTAMVNGDDGACFENLVALSLLKHCYGLQDYKGSHVNLHYLRTKDKKEVDFCLVEEDVPQLMIEVKNGKSALSKTVVEFNTKYNIPGMMLFRNIKHEKIEQGIEFRKAETFLKELYL
ncbi:MAG: ATP-binding protein [Fibrobacterales bacterium]